MKRFPTPYFSILLFLIGFSSLSFSQEIEFYDWEEDRQYTQGIDDSQGLVLIKSHSRYEYAYEDGNLICYRTEHRIYRTNNDQAIQNVNRIYVPLSGTLEVVETKARTISKEGVVQELNKNNIKEIKDEDEGNNYNIFAIEGAQEGSDVEYLYITKKAADYFGRTYFQFGIPVKQSSFHLSTPENLQFDFKSYNKLPEIESRTENERNIYEVSAENIPPLREEDFSYYDGNKMRLEFKLSYNSAGGSQRLLTWSDAGKRIADIILPIDEKEVKAAKAFLKEIKADKEDATLKSLAFAEHHIKNNFYLDDQAPQGARAVDYVLSNKYSSEQGYVRLYVAILIALELDYEIILTSERGGIPFDGSFESWNYLNNYLVRVPATGDIIAPVNFESRIGSIPVEYTPVEGLFIKEVEFSGAKSTVSQIKKIPEISYKKNFDNLVVKASFEDDNEENAIEVVRSFKGYNAHFLKVAEIKAPEEDKEEIYKEMIQFITPDADVQNLKLNEANIEYENWQEPITFSGNFKTKNFIEKAGEIILFNVGGLIGPQSELYQESERTQGVENQYNRGYYREIEVELPEGYTAQNLDELNLDVQSENGGKVVYLFKSQYTLEGNVLKIVIDEFYDQIAYPLDRFEEFRSVINAAADFNKITLVLEK